MSQTGLTLFISYAHEDESFRKDFDKHLAALRREGLVEEWHDRMIKAGQDWERQIHTNLDLSHIIVLLISPDFLASNYCSEVEVKRAMQRYEMGTARVIPVLIRPTDWKGAPFSKLQALPSNALPIAEWKGRDAAFVDVVQHLRDVCREVAAIPGDPANPYVAAGIGDWYQAEIVIDIHSTSETKLASMRLTLVNKKDRQATVRVEIKSADLGDDEKTLKIPLDRPLQDSFGSLYSGWTSEQIPANAFVEPRRTGAGAEKLFIGGNTYYTTWIEAENEVRAVSDSFIGKVKYWLSSDIQFDGMVKMVLEVPGLMTETTIVTDYGRGGQTSFYVNMGGERIPVYHKDDEFYVIEGDYKIPVYKTFDKDRLQKEADNLREELDSNDQNLLYVANYIFRLRLKAMENVLSKLDLTEEDFDELNTKSILRLLVENGLVH